jgi:hypothetical protein
MPPLSRDMNGEAATAAAISIGSLLVFRQAAVMLDVLIERRKLPLALLHVRNGA